MTWLVAGLGNPGDRYATTRHNLGHMVVDALARRAEQRFRKARFIPADVAELKEGEERVVVATSHAYMNESGPSFASLAKKYDVAPEHVIAVHDEIDLPFGALRIKVGGSTAGHNGLKSLQGALHTPEFVRVRIGVGRPPGRQDPADFVLEPFAKREVDEAGSLVETAADAVTAVIASGVDTAQDRFNRNGPRD